MGKGQVFAPMEWVKNQFANLNRNKANLDEQAVAETSNATNWTAVGIATEEQLNSYAKSKLLNFELIDGNGNLINAITVPKVSFINNYNNTTRFIKIVQGDVWAQAFYYGEGVIQMVMSDNTTLRVRAIW